jgi:CheY-like chemotaxis protein
MLNSVGVEHLIVNNENTLREVLSDGGFTHIFFDKWSESVVESFAKKSDAMFILVKEVNDIGSAAYPINTIIRPLYIVNLVRILGGNTLSMEDSELYREIKLGEFKTTGVHVLLVDDHPANLIVAEGMLRQYGITVSTVASGREAIEIVKKKEFDIVFMDHMMPEMDGIEATKLIRGMKGRFAEMPIIALSANAVSGARETFIEAGMNEFLSKPIIINDLHRLLLEYIQHEKVLI